MAGKEREERIDEWKQALWDFILEHCEVTQNGALFVKFHTSGRADLEKRIRARWKYGYHREDVRAKEAMKDERKRQHDQKKQERHERWLASRQERQKVYERVRRANARRAWLKKWFGWLK